MYNISSKALEKLKKCSRQSVSISVNGISESITLDMSDITEAPTIKRRSVTGDRIEIGAVTSSTLKMALYNKDGRFDNFTFEGAEMYVRFSVKLDNSTTEYIPMGYFTVDAPPRKLKKIQISAFDRMMRFNRPYDTALSYPATLYGILSDACSKCGVPLKTLSSELTNASYRVEKRPETDGLTYRQVIEWIAELTATCAWIDWDGKLRLTWYTDTSTSLTKADMFSADMYEKSVAVTGVQILANDEEGTPYLSGTDDYAFCIEGNLLAQEDLQSLANNIYAKVGGFTYRPYSCDTISYPHLWPLDKITYFDIKGNAYPSVITDHTITLNGKSKISAQGKTAEQNEYSVFAPLTARERAILERLRAQTHREISDRQQAALEMNEIMLNSGGLYQTGIEQPDGSVKYYFHDKPKLEESSYICTRNAGGFASTTSGWNNGNPVWINGVTRDGNAILNAINTYELSANIITSGRLQSKDGKNYIDLDTGDVLLGGYVTDDDLNDAIGKIELPNGTYVYYRYSANADGRDMVMVPVDGVHKYMGILSTNNEDDQYDYTKYTWSKICGADGYTPIKGVDYTDGKDGQSQYFHVKYSDDGKTFSGNVILNNKVTWENGDYSLLNGNKGNTAGRIRISELVPVVPNTSYIVNTGIKNISFVLRAYDSNKKFTRSIGGVANGKTFSTLSDEAYIGIAIYSVGYVGAINVEALPTLINNGFLPDIREPSNNGEELGEWIGTLVSDSPVPSEVFSDYTWKKFTENVDEDLKKIWTAIEKSNEQIALKVGKGADEIISAINLNTTGAKIQAKNIDLVIGGKDNKDGQLTVRNAEGRVISLLDKDGQFMFPENSDNIIHFSSADWGHGLYYYRPNKIDAALAFLDDGTKTTARLASGPGNSEIVSFGEDSTNNIQAYCAVRSDNGYGNPEFILQARKEPKDGGAMSVVSLSGDEENGLLFMNSAKNRFGEVYDTGNLLIESGNLNITLWGDDNAPNDWVGYKEIKLSYPFTANMIPIVTNNSAWGFAMNSYVRRINSTTIQIHASASKYRYGNPPTLDVFWMVIEPKPTAGYVSVSNFVPQTYTPPLLEEV